MKHKIKVSLDNIELQEKEIDIDMLSLLGVSFDVGEIVAKNGNVFKVEVKLTRELK